MTRASAPGLLLAITTLAISACDEADGATGSAPASAAAVTEPEAPPARVSCVDLPGAVRTALQLSSDGKTLHYAASNRRQVGSESVVSYDLHAFDIASGTDTLVVADVGPDPVVAPDGTIVFRRPTGKRDLIGNPRHAIMIKPVGKEAFAVTDDKVQVGEFAVDAQTSTIAIVMGEYFPDELWKVPLAGGKPEQLGKAYGIYGVTDGAVIIGSEGGLVRQPLAGGTATALAIPTGRRALAFHPGGVFLVDDASKAVSNAALSQLGTATELGVTNEKLRVLVGFGSTMLLAEKGASHEIRAFDGTTAELLATMTDARPRDAIRIGDRVALLVINDTDADGEATADDETDLCIASVGPEPFSVPNRRIPKRFLATAEQLAALTATGELAGATMRFFEVGGTEVVELAMAEGSGDLDALRALVRRVQTQVQQLTGLPKLSVAIEVRSSGARALSTWDEDAGTFLVSAGRGTAQVVDRTQYQAKVDPKVGIALSNSYGSELGTATCSGTIENISTTPLVDVEVHCTGEAFGQKRSVNARLSPSTLAPGAIGKYKVKLGEVDGSKPIPLSVYAGAMRLTYLNAFAEQRATAILAMATKLHEATKLRYRMMLQSADRAAFRGGKSVHVYLHLDAELAAGSPEARAAAAQAALPLVSEYLATDRNLEGPPVLLLMPPDSMQVGWTFANGRLTDGAPES